MTNEQQEKLVADMQAEFRDYMATPEFKARAEAACARIESGEHLETPELAECLGLPERLVEKAMEAQGKLIKATPANHLTIWQLAAALNTSPESIRQCYEGGLDLLLKSRSTDPTMVSLMRTAEFKRAVKRMRDFVDDDVTLHSVADKLGIPDDVMSWAFLEARARGQSQPTTH
jgi:hypothetical protein